MGFGEWFWILYSGILVLITFSLMYRNGRLSEKHMKIYRRLFKRCRR